jgi:hypothetical protein
MLRFNIFIIWYTSYFGLEGGKGTILLKNKGEL